MHAGSLKTFSTCVYKSVPDPFVLLVTGGCRNEINNESERVLLFDDERTKYVLNGIHMIQVAFICICMGLVTKQHTHDSVFCISIRTH
jgi:hypothetical protein